MSSQRRHARNESFGEFVTADEDTGNMHVEPAWQHSFEPQASQVEVTELPEPRQHRVLDLREVERKLDAERQKQADRQEESVAMAAAVDPGLSLVAEPVAMQEPPPEPEASTSHASHWSGSLWNKLSSIRAMADLRNLVDEEPHARERRPSVVRRAHTMDAPIAGAPGFDASASRRWNTGSWSLSGAEERKRELKPIPVSLMGRRDDTDAVCDTWHAARIQASLPRRLRLGKTWRLLYSLDQDGSSLATLYDKVARAMDPRYRRTPVGGEAWLRGSSQAAQEAALGGASDPGIRHVGSGVALSDAGLVLAVTDANGNVFGAFINEPLKVASHYYGNGECFLWKTVHRRLPCPPSEAGGDGSDEHDLHPDKAIEVFRWTGRNDYVVLSESNFLSVGGGDGRYGLWVDDTLDRGLSAKCPAFNNEVLCNSIESDAVHATDSKEVPTGDLLSGFINEAPIPETGKFQVMGVEVWAVGID